MSGNGPTGTHEPEIVVLFCQQSVDRNVELANSYRSLPGIKVRLIVLPCSSNVEVGQIIKILEKGADAIQIVACSEEACRFLVGSNKAERRVEYVRQLLEEINFGPERVGIVRGMNLSAKQLLDRARERADLVRALGPNPMRKNSGGHIPESSPHAA